MPIDIKRWKEHEAQLHEEARKSKLYSDEVTRQSRIKADQLTQHPLWDHYLTHLQPHRAAAEEQCRLAQKAAVEALTDNEVRKAQLIHARCAGIVDALTTAMNLPKQLLAQGQEPAPPPPADQRSL